MRAHIMVKKGVDIMNGDTNNNNIVEEEVSYEGLMLTPGVDGSENGAYLLPFDETETTIDVENGDMTQNGGIPLPNGNGQSGTREGWPPETVTPSLPSDGQSGGLDDEFSVTPTPDLQPNDQRLRPGFWPSGIIRPNRPSNGSNVNVIVVPITPSFTSLSYVRFFNGNGTGETVDIYINNRLVVKNLVFKQFSRYFSALPGNYRLTVYKSYTMQLLFTSTMRIQANYVYTAAISGTQGNQNLKLVSSRRRFTSPNISYVRFINLAQDAPSMDIYVDGVLTISDLQYREVSNYMPLIPGEHSIVAQASATSSTVLVEDRINFESGEYYGSYIVGNLNTRPVIQIITEGETR